MLAWFQLASHLGMSLDETMRQTSYTQLLMWTKYLQNEVNVFHREDWYMAQIAAEVRRAFSSKPQDVKTKDFILDFKTGMDSTTDVEQSEIDTAARMQQSKNFWSAVAQQKG